jgi:PI-3-kinase-related kinase SMG-1
LGPTETHGPFRCAAEATLVALRRLPARQALLGSLELLTRDPLMEWIDDGAAAKGGKHTRRGDEAREHAALELAHGLASFAGKIQDASAALGPEGSDDLGCSPGSSWSATFLLSRKFHEHLAALKTKVTKDGAAVIAAAEAAEKAETAWLEARDALAASARASDAEEFSASGVSAASLNLRDAIDCLASAATDARQWSDRHRRALDRLAPDSGDLVRLKHKTTTTEDTGGAPMLRAAPMAASLALSPELQSAAGAIDGEGARLLAARDEAVDRATSSLERYREWVVANLPSSYPESDRRAVWANTLEEAAKVRVEAPGEAIERLGELIDATRVTDSDGKRAWTKYCAATGAWHARESTELPALRAEAKAAADAYTKYARKGTRQYPGNWESTVNFMFKDMLQGVHVTREGPTLSWLDDYVSCPPVRDERQTEVQTVDSPPDESNELFVPSSGFFGDMEGDGEELGGLGDEDEDLLEREISNLRVEDDLDIEELMNDDDVSPSPEPRVADDESDDDDTERFLAMPRREKSAVMAAAMYSVFNSDEYDENYEYDEKAESLTRFLPPKTFVDLAMDSAMLPHKVMRYILPIALDPQAVDPMRSMRIVEAAQVSQALDRRAHDLQERHWRDSGATDVEIFWREGEALAAELKAHVESLAQDMPALTEALLAHVCCDTVLRPNIDPEYAGCWIHPVYAVKAVSKLVTRILAACAANVSGDLREENIVADEHDVGVKLEDVAATVIKEAEEAADIININVVEHTLENTFGDVAPPGYGGPTLEGATKGKDVRTMLDAAARAVYAVRRSAAEAELADRERRHATSSGAISRCEWLLESRLEQGSDGAWGFETDPTASRRWRTQHLDHVATAAAELASADIAVRSWAQRAGALERSFFEYFHPWADRDRMETLARSLEDRGRALKDSEQRAATCRQLCEGVESFERSREPEREAAAAETLLPEGFLDFSFDAGLDETDEPDPIRAAGGIAKNPFKKKGKKPVSVTEVQTQRSKRSNAEVAGGFEKTYEAAVTDVILACEEVLQTAMAPAGPKAEAAAAARAEASEKAEKARELERIVDEKRRAIVDDIDVMAFIWHGDFPGSTANVYGNFYPTAKMEPKSTPWYLRELEIVATDLRNALCTPGTPVARFIEETRKHLDGLNALFPKVPTDLVEAIDIDEAETCAGEAWNLLKEFEEDVGRCIQMAIDAMDYSHQALTEAQHSREHGFTYSEEFSSAIRWFANATADLDTDLSSTVKLLRAELDDAQSLSRQASIEIKEHTGLGLTAAPPPDDDTEPPRRVEQPADSSDDEDETIAAAATVRRRGSAHVTRWRGGRHPTAVRLISVVAAKLDGRPKLVEMLRFAASATPAPKVPSPPTYSTFGRHLSLAAKGETPLTAKQDVDRLIAEATDARRLASMYEGWCPWL